MLGFDIGVWPYVFLFFLTFYNQAVMRVARPHTYRVVLYLNSSPCHLIRR